MDMNDSQRFWSKVDVRDDKDECWEWQASKDKLGYGWFRLKERPILAHRFALLGYDALLPKNLFFNGSCVCHHCDNPSCCNPKHLYLGTHQDNMQDIVDRRSSKKLSTLQVKEIKKLLYAKIKIKDIADIFNVSSSTIYKIKEGNY